MEGAKWGHHLPGFHMHLGWERIRTQVGRTGWRSYKIVVVLPWWWWISRCEGSLPANTKRLYTICTTSDQRQSRWADVVHMSYKWFVFAGLLYTQHPKHTPLPANTRRSANVGTMLGQRRRRWANIAPTLAERLVFSGSFLVPVVRRRSRSNH